MKPMRISPAVIAQTTIGTSRIRPESDEIWNAQRAPHLDRHARPQPRPFSLSEYTHGQAIAHLRFPRSRRVCRTATSG